MLFQNRYLDSRGSGGVRRMGTNHAVNDLEHDLSADLDPPRI